METDLSWISTHWKPSPVLSSPILYPLCLEVPGPLRTLSHKTGTPSIPRSRVGDGGKVCSTLVHSFAPLSYYFVHCYPIRPPTQSCIGDIVVSIFPSAIPSDRCAGSSMVGYGYSPVWCSTYPGHFSRLLASSNWIPSCTGQSRGL